MERVVQMHIAGHTDCGTHIIDTHDHPVVKEVWKLYEIAQQKAIGASTLLEWDAKIPSFPELQNELNKAKLLLQKGRIEMPKEQRVQKVSVPHPLSIDAATTDQIELVK